MKHLRVHLAALLVRLDTWLAWPECAGCGRRHDPAEH